MTEWPSGTRAVIDEDGSVTSLPDDHPVEYWICFRVDEPATWKRARNQRQTACVDCQSAIVYCVSPKNPTDPAVKKICRRCMARKVSEPESFAGSCSGFLGAKPNAARGWFDRWILGNGSRDSF